MKLKDVKIGMKVIPHSKNAGEKDLNQSSVWRRVKLNKQPFLYVTGLEGMTVLLNSEYIKNNGDYFLASDFKPYIEKTESKTNRQTIDLIFNGTTTIALLKDKKGKYTKAIAKLHHEDTYNQLEGIRVAVGRALGLEVDFPKEKTLSDFTNEELLKELEKRMKPKSEFLTYDEIRNLPNGTIIEYTDNYSGRDSIKYGYINQYKKWISMNDKIDWCNWYFDSLEEYEIQAKLSK